MCPPLLVPCGESNNCYGGRSGKILSERLGQHKDDTRLGHLNNSVFKHVRHTSYVINWENSKMVFSENDSYQRLVVEAALIKILPNFNSTQSTLAIDSTSSNLILKSKPGTLRDLQK